MPAGHRKTRRAEERRKVALYSFFSMQGIGKNGASTQEKKEFLF